MFDEAPIDIKSIDQDILKEVYTDTEIIASASRHNIKIELHDDDTLTAKYTRVMSRYSLLDVVMDNKLSEIRKWQCLICHGIAINASKPYGSAPCECVSLYCATCLKTWLEKEGKCPTCKKTAIGTYRDLLAQNDIKNLTSSKLKVFKCPVETCKHDRQTLTSLRQHLWNVHDQPALSDFRSDCIGRAWKRARSVTEGNRHAIQGLTRQVQHLSWDIEDKNNVIKDLEEQVQKLRSRISNAKLTNVEVVAEPISLSMVMQKVWRFLEFKGVNGARCRESHPIVSVNRTLRCHASQRVNNFTDEEIVQDVVRRWCRWEQAAREAAARPKRRARLSMRDSKLKVARIS